jgi:hypothetical protein
MMGLGLGGGRDYWRGIFPVGCLGRLAGLLLGFGGVWYGDTIQGDDRDYGVVRGSFAMGWYVIWYAAGNRRISIQVSPASITSLIHATRQ